MVFMKKCEKEIRRNNDALFHEISTAIALYTDPESDDVDMVLISVTILEDLDRDKLHISKLLSS